jgi:nitroreductase
MIVKLADTQVPIHELIARRWSGRAFDPGKPIARTQLIALLEAARWAPSCYGDEPWRYIVWERRRDEASWKKAFECLGKWNQGWVKNAPLLLLSIADTLFWKDGKPNRWGAHDTGAASENLCLQAVALGLMAHQMGGFDAEKVRHAFTFPERYMPIAMIAVGHPTSAEILDETYRESGLGPRRRRPLGECFYEGGWEIPIAI